MAITTHHPISPANRDLQRADDLLRQKTIEEKAMQLSPVVQYLLRT